MSSKVFRSVQVMLGLLALLLFVATLWPLLEIRQSMAVDPAFLDPALLESCPILRHLTGYHFELRYPARMWLSTSTPLYFLIQGQQTTMSTTEREACVLNLQASLQLGDVVVFPGNLVIAPFVGKPSQSLEFSLSAPQAGEYRGELWIHAAPVPKSGASPERLPLFSIPVRISAVSLLGLPPDLVRYACLFIWLILLVTWMRRKTIAML